MLPEQAEPAKEAAKEWPEKWEQEGALCGVTGQGQKAFKERAVVWVACYREV